MHWLATQVEALHRLAAAHEGMPQAGRRTTATGRERVTGPSGPEGKARYQAFVAGARDLVGAIAARPGVTACVACHDGLLVDAAGRAPSFEALAAMTQSCTLVAHDAASALSLGAVQQLVIVGQSHKLALFVVGQLALGILSPATVNLASALAE